MANKHYDEFCEAELPNLNRLERQLLGHICARYNEEVKPPRAWPSLAELKRITGAHDKSISRGFTGLVNKSYLFRVTRARIGRQSEYAPNMLKIRQHKVTHELPINNEQVTETEVTGNATVISGSPTSYPKPNKPIKPTSQLVDDLLTIIPKDNHFTITPEFVSMLEQLNQHGTSYNDLKADLRIVDWVGIKLPKEFVISRLKEKLAKPPRYSYEIKPTWCGKCDELSRQLSERVLIPNGNGSTTYSCLDCDPFMVNRVNGY
jgi:hypothetical protein